MITIFTRVKDLYRRTITRSAALMGSKRDTHNKYGRKLASCEDEEALKQGKESSALEAFQAIMQPVA